MGGADARSAREPRRRTRRRAVVAVVLLAAAVALAALALWNALAGAARLRGSDVYAEVLARAQSHPAVIEALGEPIVPGRRVRGELDDGGPAGRARLAVPLAGPRGSGRLIADAERRGEVWSFTRLELRLDGGETIDLLAAPPPPDDTGTVVRLRRPAPPPPWHAVGIDGRS